MTHSVRIKSIAVSAVVALAGATLIAACGGGSGGLSNFQKASLAIGQPNLESGERNRGGAPNAESLHTPLGMALTPEGGLLLADVENNRVLFFPSVPEAMGARAHAVLGQPNFESSTASVTADGLSQPWSVAVGAGRMAVADRAANRVLIYDGIPAAGLPMPVASVVIGQPDFTASGASCGPSGLHGPTGVAITPDGKLLVADRGNNRLLVWERIPAPGAPVPAPSLVLGQSDLTRCAFADLDQDGAPDRDPGSSLVTSQVNGRVMVPAFVWSDGRRLVVSDGDFNRVLVWTSFPTADFQAADLVLGQADFTGRWANGASSRGELAASTARSFYDPGGVHSDGISLAVADQVNNRVLVWSTFPQVNHQAADIVLGHAGFTEAATNDSNGDGLPDAPNAQVFARPGMPLFTADALLASDMRHHRVLKFKR